ncbi:hypothetical protein Q9L42_015700 [Methylomarinum sp. Ch1-1]|uniref:HNH endonuclease n=1 Tax=Methylomarinum roseum TaxID=3067653 RepID=A0AAU7NS08_9GAMM|nr:hypothetical protein [Methylomarinum sp. Ch1-1]MDP4520217.1 hypothetical protein [Methylomarinum sp. Ch1-1]
MAFNDEMIQAVWEKGRGTSERDSNEWRQDQCGAWLNREQYENAESEYGWRILNVVADGKDELDNLQPFHCQNSFDIANSKAHCCVAADRSGLTPTQSVDQPRNTNV